MGTEIKNGIATTRLRPQEEGGSGAVFGYLYNGTFYSDEEHTQEITPAEDTIYVDKTSNASYTWDGTEYVVMGSGDTSEQEESAAAAINDIYEQTLSPVRRTILREDVIDALNKPWENKPLSAKQGFVLDSKFGETELATAAALCELNETKAFIDALAPAWDGRHTYSVGDLRTYNGRLWKCDTAITVPTPEFDATKWHTTTIVAEVFT